MKDYEYEREMERQFSLREDLDHYYRMHGYED